MSLLLNKKKVGKIESLLLTPNRVRKLEAIADSVGPLLDSPLKDYGSERDDFDYKIFKFLNSLLSKDTGTSDAARKMGRTKVHMSDGTAIEVQFADIISTLDEQDPVLQQLYTATDNTQSAKVTAFNSLLKRTLKSFEQILHHKGNLDNYFPKTVEGRRAYLYRAMMRGLIEDREKNIERIGFWTEQTKARKQDSMRPDPNSKDIFRRNCAEEGDFADRNQFEHRPPNRPSAQFQVPESSKSWADNWAKLLSNKKI